MSFYIKLASLSFLSCRTPGANCLCRGLIYRTKGIPVPTHPKLGLRPCPLAPPPLLHSGSTENVIVERGSLVHS